MVHKAQNLVKVLKMRLQVDGFNHQGNFVVKHAQARVVLGCVTSQEVSVLRPYEHYLYQMCVKCSIYTHEIWIHVESLLMKHGSMSLTQNHTINS